jgi:hypothetical protein
MGMQSIEDLPELAPYLPEMDDIEEELAAQTIPTPSEEGASGESPAESTDQQPANAVGDAVAGQDELAAAAGAEAVGEARAADEEPADESAEDLAAVDAPDEDTGSDDAPADDDTGIDGDLSIDEPVDLDLAHEAGELEPSDEVEPAEAGADEAGELEAADEVGPDGQGDRDG